MDIPNNEVKQSFSIKEDFKKFINKFTRTRKRKIVSIISLLVVFSLLIGGGVLVIKLNSPQSGIKVAENLASDKVWDNYDYIYNSGDNKLVASTLDRLKQLELISGEDKIIDYIISPDKKKITYSVSPKDYKSRITSTNIQDLTKLRFDPVAFKMYELNLETGTNTLIWSIDSINLGSTEQQVYKTKQIVHPDSYVVGYEVCYIPEIHAGGTCPISYPVSYISYENDLEAEYMIDYLPWDLQQELNRKKIELISYNSDSNWIVFIENNYVRTLMKDTNDQRYYPLSYVNKYQCDVSSGQWISNILYLTNNCRGWGYETTFKFDNNSIERIDYRVSETRIVNTVLLRPTFSILSDSEPYSENPKNQVSSFDFSSLNTSKIKDLEKNEYAVAVESSEDIIALRIPESNDNNSKMTYSFYKYNHENNSLEKFLELKLPNDIYGLSYDSAKNRLSYYRKYQASTESIIEYRILDTASQEEKELLTIKVDNDSALYYNPKLVWFDHE